MIFVSGRAQWGFTVQNVFHTKLFNFCIKSGLYTQMLHMWTQSSVLCKLG